MADQVFFSIIIPTYNRKALLQKAIQSVQQQSEVNWEIIVVDDGSTDGTQEMIQAYSSEKISYFHQENQERSAARNLGIRHASGQYICFLDDDDYFLEQHLTVLKERIQAEHFPVAIFRTGMITEYGHKTTYSTLFDPQRDQHPIPFFLKHISFASTIDSVD